MRRFWQILALVVLSAGVVPGTADALYRTSEIGDMDIGGRIRTTNTFRHADVDRWAFIMQRNELKLRFEWKWLQRGKAFGRWNVGWLDRSDIYLLYRGVYDSIYDFTPGQIESKDLQGDPIPRFARSLDSIPDKTRDEIKFNNHIREAYIDLYFKNLPLTLRIGKQQIVWGESDGFRMLDRANTLDLSWHFFQELPPPGFGFDDLRQPFFMIKGLWDFKQLGPLSQPFLEFYWNPGDWNPGKVSFLPRPWGVKLLDPINNAAGTGAADAGTSFCQGIEGGDCSLLKGTTLLRQGDWDRNPIDNSQFGLRFHFITPQGVEMTLNYLYQRFSPDGSPVALVRGVPIEKEFFVEDTLGIPGNQPGTLTASQYCDGLRRPQGDFGAPWATRTLCAEYFAPYVHTVGMSLNWFEGDYTQTVWRVETIVDFDLPFYNGDRQTALFARSPDGIALLPGLSRRNMWKGMLAFDRPTWIKWLNKQTTFFVTGQFFWHYIINHERRRCWKDNVTPFVLGTDGQYVRDENGKRVPNPQFDPDVHGLTSSPLTENCGGPNPAGGPELLTYPGEQTGFVGGLDLPKLSNPFGDVGRNRDTIHQWELLGTLAILGFYRGGSLVPALIYLLDPVNSYSQELAFGVDWFIRPDISVNVTTRLIWAGLPWDAYDGHQKSTDPDGGQFFDPWFLAGGSRGRSETAFQINWQF